MSRSVLMAVLLLTLSTGGVASAQPPAEGGGGIGSLIKRLPKPGAAPAPAPAPAASATRFKPSGKRVLIEKLLKATEGTAAEKKQLKEALEAVVQAYETEAAKLKMENDIAGAAAFYVAVHYQIYTGGEDLSDKGTVALYRQFASVMDTDDVRKMTDAQKQDIYEALTVTTAIHLIQYQAAVQSKNEDELKSIKAASGKALKDLLKVDPDRIKLTEAGMVAAGGGAATGDSGEKPATDKPDVPEKADNRAAVPGGVPSLIVNTDGWTRVPTKDSTVMVTRQLSKGKLVIFYSLVPFKGEGGREQTFWNFWKSSTQGIRVDPLTQMPVMGRRMIGNTPALFYSAKVARVRDVMSDVFTAYLLEAGDAYYFILVRYGPNDVSGIDGATDTLNAYNVRGKDDVYSATEEFLKGVKLGAPTTRKPLFTAADVRGNWKKSVTASSASYVTTTGTYAGDASSGYSEELRLLPDGTYKQTVAVVLNGRYGNADSAEGTYRVEDDRLILTATRTTRNDGKKVDVRRIIAAGRGLDGQPCLILGTEDTAMNLYGILLERAYEPVR